MRRIVQQGMLILTLSIAVLGMSAAAQAQDGSGDRVREELQRTDEGLDKARDIVRESDSQRARDVLATAIRIQAEAWGTFRHGRFLQAARLTTEARQVGARAVSLAREDSVVRNRARREGERAMRALSAARDHIGGDSGGSALRLLEQAAELIERGRVKFGEQRYEAALRLAMSAQQLVRQAVGLSGSTDGAPRILRELERTDHLIDRVADLVRDSDNPDASAMLDRGRKVQARAWEAYHSDRWRAAGAGTREARNLVNRARGLAHGPMDASSVERALAETDRILDRASDVVMESGSDPAASILDRARGHQAKAHDLLSEGELRKALAETRVARSLAKRALRAADTTGAR